MESKEWRFQDVKDKLIDGPWQNEPDKAQWMDEETGLPCLIVRQGHSGHLCGYVGVPEGHPLYKVGYWDCPAKCGKEKYADGGDNCTHDHPDSLVDVHGGLTFASLCQEDKDRGVCHTPGPGEPEHVWWFGFDCAHSGDKSSLGKKYMKFMESKKLSSIMFEGTYRDFAYVKAECARLAKQLAEVARRTSR